MEQCLPSALAWIRVRQNVPNQPGQSICVPAASLSILNRSQKREPGYIRRRPACERVDYLPATEGIYTETRDGLPSSRSALLSGIEEFVEFVESSGLARMLGLRFVNWLDSG